MCFRLVTIQKIVLQTFGNKDIAFPLFISGGKKDRNTEGRCPIRDCDGTGHATGLYSYHRRSVLSECSLISKYGKL